MFKQHRKSDNSVWFTAIVVNEVPMGENQTEREKPAGGHHAQSSDNNKFSVIG